MNDSIPELKIEIMGDKSGLILLEQDSGGNIDRVAIHSVHLRYIAEKMELLESSDLAAQKTMAALQRRLLVLRDRMENLHDYLVNHSDHRHADLSYEVTYATACVDIADEFCADFDSTASAHEFDADTVSADGEKTLVPKRGSSTTPSQMAIEL
jgi:hypothetical protein